ncbi:DUF305 domain-containing protein [Nonomuraea sediminis]|uniref:DUF305 domain-containing protein n=1 Tax=Nonomuraea sediminis TaxID=2835864 RepID=UPI001BDCB419|nr:DUF305 domain-containing protein [Nonomuraea sediminis]
MTTVACGSSADHDQADVRFSEDMIVHHRQTIQLAKLASGRGESAYVRGLSAKLVPAEEADIATMSAWLRSWQAPPPPVPVAQVGAELRAGPGFDRRWMAALSTQLEHGIQMAEAVKAAGRHGPTRELADRIITEHRATLADLAKRPA